MSFKIETHWTKGVTTRPGGVAAVIGRAHVGITRVLAKQILKRVAMQGKPAQGKHTYSTDTTPPKMISPRYPVKGSPRQGKSGVYLYRNSQEFHSAMGTKPGSFNVSGGMWSGLTTVITPGKSFIRFRGRSEGQGMALKIQAKAVADPHFRRNAKGKVLAKPKKVPNALKAGTVLKSTRVNVLMPTRAEYQSITDAAMEVAWTSIPSIGDAKVTWARQARGDSLARKMARAVRVRRAA